MEPVIETTVACANCGTALMGEYCHACGQKRIAEDWQSVPRFLRQFTDELVRLDFKTVRTVAALFNPGKLPAEFLAGRRREYLGPLKVYFVCAALFFFLGPLVSGFSLEDLLRSDTDGVLRRWVDAARARKQMDPALFAERFSVKMQTVYTLILSVSILAYAFTLKLLFKRSAPAFVTHLVVALYYVAFFYMMALMTGAIDKLAGGLHPLITLGLAYAFLAPYAYVSLRRVYGEPPARTLWKAAIVLVVGFVIDSPVNLAAMFLTFALI
jgi:hypothetical protein